MMVLILGKEKNIGDVQFIVQNDCEMQLGLHRMTKKNYLARLVRENVKAISDKTEITKHYI
jgi:hypothetical protein